jgi:Protein of unknown function (DUF2370)
MYTQVANRDDDDHIQGPPAVPSSPPPPFRSRPSSIESHRLLSQQDPLISDADRTLAETFDSPSDDEGSEDEHDDDGGDDRRRLISRTNTEDATSVGATAATASHPGIERRVTQLPVFAARSGRTYGGGGGNDGVFANLSAKPSRGEDVDEKPPVSDTSLAVWSMMSNANVYILSPTNKQPPMQRLRTGRRPSSPLA